MLHVDVYGDGPDLVLIHGWGMHGGLFARWAKGLGEFFRVTVVDLPGHGNSHDVRCDELEQWATSVLDVAPAQAVWVGWSLGGMVALAAAAIAAQRCRALVLLASTPRFVTDKGWETAVDARVLDQFVRQLEVDSERTLSRFLALQIRGSERGGDTLRCLRTELGKRPQPDLQALHAGLDLLLHADQRQLIQHLDVPLFGIFGERDTLVPAQVAELLPMARFMVIRGAGHAPFISHERQCTEQLQRWLLTDTVPLHAAN